MAYRGKYARQTKKSKLPVILLVFLLMAVCVLGACALFADDAAPPAADNPVETTQIPTETLTEPLTEPAPTETEPPPTTEPAPVIYTATVGAMGDLLMHKPLFDSQYSAEVYQSGEYNFDSIFKYIQEDVSALDYAVVNLETTLAGKGNGYPYSGYPSFNCPDDLVDSVKTTGFDMMLTANNHSYDTNIKGYKRTLEVVHNAGLASLGTYNSADESKWKVENISGVNIGMLCYTYATDVTSDGRPILNGGNAIKEKDICNYFTYDKLDKFYAEVETSLAEMKEAGADATMMFIHWGEEYQLTENSYQQKMAQKLCDLGIDVIVGGHPHVVQPIELLESTVDANHKTICLYSTGNAVSNQRQGAISAIKTAHTEDGILFSVTFEKIEGGNTRVSGVQIIPTWVNMFMNGRDRREYNILPLHRNSVDTWQEDFELSDEAYTKAKKSFDRTMAIVGKGLQQIQDYLDSYVPTTGKETNLLELAQSPRRNK